jgi:hypothetical protein
MSEGEWALTISTDYPLSFVFARARFCPDTRKILENELPISRYESPRRSNVIGKTGALAITA